MATPSRQSQSSEVGLAALNTKVDDVQRRLGLIEASLANQSESELQRAEDRGRVLGRLEAAEGALREEKLANAKAIENVREEFNGRMHRADNWVRALVAAFAVAALGGFFTWLAR